MWVPIKWVGANLISSFERSVRLIEYTLCTLLNLIISKSLSHGLSKFNRSIFINKIEHSRYINLASFYCQFLKLRGYSKNTKKIG